MQAPTPLVVSASSEASPMSIATLTSPSSAFTPSKRPHLQLPGFVPSPSASPGLVCEEVGPTSGPLPDALRAQYLLKPFKSRPKPTSSSTQRCTGEIAMTVLVSNVAQDDQPSTRRCGGIAGPTVTVGAAVSAPPGQHRQAESGVGGSGPCSETLTCASPDPGADPNDREGWQGTTTTTGGDDDAGGHGGSTASGPLRKLLSSLALPPGLAGGGHPATVQELCAAAHQRLLLERTRCQRLSTEAGRRLEEDSRLARSRARAQMERRPPGR